MGAPTLLTDWQFLSIPLNAGWRVDASCLCPMITHFQSTPLSEGRPQHRGFIQGRRHISIHTPQRGATSLHHGGQSEPFYFNPHPSARGDVSPGGGVPCLREISIHTPQRGATICVFHGKRPRKFQSTPLSEGRLTAAPSSVQTLSFQSTPLSEGRRPWCRTPPGHIDFNPHPSARGDDFP